MEFASPLGTTDYHLDNLVCDVLQSTERYHLKREEIAKTLASGFFALSRAKKSNQSFIASPEDIRSGEIESTITLQSDREDGAGPYTIDEDLVSDTDPMLMICALPPPPLKQAKREFRHVVMLCNALLHDVYQIQRTCEGIEVWQGMRSEENCPFTDACKLSGSIKQTKLAFNDDIGEEGEEEGGKKGTVGKEEPIQVDVGLRQRTSKATTTSRKPVNASYGDSDDFNYKVADLSTDDEEDDD